MENNSFEIKVLGSVSPYCKDNRNCPGFLVNYYGRKILLDCGNGISRLLTLPDDLNNLSVFISHFHKDHYADLLSLGYASYVYNKLGILNEKVKLYIPKTQEKYDNFFDSLLIKNMKEQYFDITEYSGDSKFNINGLDISFLVNAHDYPSYSTKLSDKLSSIVYTGDTGYSIAKELYNFASNVDLLIAESTFLRTDNQVSETHLHAYQAAEIASLAKVKKLLLFHFWPEHNSKEYLEEAKTIFENSHTAEEGKVLKIR